MYGEEGWTTGASIHLYRCLKVYFPTTRAVRDVNTATFFQKDIPFPKVNLEDYLQQATIDIRIIHPAAPSTLTRILEARYSTCNALFNIAEILHRSEKLQYSLPSTPYPKVPIKITESQRMPHRNDIVVLRVRKYVPAPVMHVPTSKHMLKRRVQRLA